MLEPIAGIMLGPPHWTGGQPSSEDPRQSSSGHLALQQSVSCGVPVLHNAGACHIGQSIASTQAQNTHGWTAFQVFILSTPWQPEKLEHQVFGIQKNHSTTPRWQCLQPVRHQLHRWDHAA